MTTTVGQILVNDAPEQAPTASSGGVNQDAIKAAVIEALGDMGAMR